MAVVFESPIKVPGSPFWTVFRRFGRDELLALLISVIGTAILSLFTTNPLLLAVTGPVIEKLGFFPIHFKEAYDVYRTTAKERRRSLSHYVKQAFKGSFTSLLEDILIHDPLYIAGVFFGIMIYPVVPVWILSAVSFIVAVVVVAFLEVAYTEIRYWQFTRSLKTKKFGSEAYYESRFFIDKRTDPQAVLNKLATHFSLSVLETRHYADRYFENNLPMFSGRSPKLRIRSRTSPTKEDYLPSVQITYTRARELSKGYDQYRFFPIRKEKFYYLLEQDSAPTIRQISDKSVRDFLDKVHDARTTWTVEFDRFVARSDELFVSADIFEDREYYILEIKVHKDMKKLAEAMRFVMQEFPVQQTTQAKSDS